MKKLYEKSPGLPKPVLYPEVFITEESQGGSLGDSRMPEILQNQSSIRSATLELKFIGPSPDRRSVLFHLVSESFELGLIPLELDLGLYYEMEYKTRRPGGMYVFNPQYLDLNQTDIVKRYYRPYAEFQNGTLSKTSDGQGEMMLYFSVDEDLRQLSCWEEGAMSKGSQTISLGYEGDEYKDCYSSRRVQVILRIDEKANLGDWSETI